MDTIANRRYESPFAPYGYLITDKAWRAYRLDDLERTVAPGPASPRVRFARGMAARINAIRDFSHPGARPAKAGEILTMGLLTEVLRYIAEFYCRLVNPQAVGGALSHIREQQGSATVSTTLDAFAGWFPPVPVRRGETTAPVYLAGVTAGMSHRECAVIETMMATVSWENPALAPYRELHDLEPLRAHTAYDAYIRDLDAWFVTQPPFPDTGLPLLETLRAPFRSCPDSLEDQLAFMVRQWRAFLPEGLLDELMVAQGVLREETTLRGMGGPGPQQALSFTGLDSSGYAEPEAFSTDQDWMPNVVLLAKTVYVWLFQLSRKYGRPITRLDQIPDAELDQLAHWGFTALWLIGLWERSCASRDIKRRMGNPEAESSAYSLYDYDIADDLGGEAAYHSLAERAWKRGIRLASDMVPNHMGIHSRWVVEHPDWFMQLREPPFPGYQFTGPNLSPDARVGLYIEDGYWNHSDAAVVFKRVDQWTGDTRYIYHGNDGTSMPWNDTAQLNFMLAEVREAVIQTILHVARKSPIIRFDAAMTLAKRHYQRLWFPKPGEGGAIPSRAEHGMDKEGFDQAFPEEFWRQVVDRIAAEVPNTLLLAEAFWLMEGYFVRTLGMHRVYNSAFMNMLKDEDNAKYRQTIKNVLEFSPEVLQRFVNFMNNPDEETAVAQFGKGDKYFGVSMMLATMPGLPMFGHGQMEGFTEKYGMEYRRSYYDESPDEGLIARHEREIFPLVRRRYLFSGARHFALYDFTNPDGWVDENVFAYSNRAGGDRALLIYNNTMNTTRGVIHTSTAINEGSAENKILRRASLADALALNTDDKWYLIFRDQRTGLEYLHHTRTLAGQGLHLELEGYAHCAFIDWRQVEDFDHSWGRLHAMLGGRGVSSIEEEYLEMHLASLLDPFRELMSAEVMTIISDPKRTDAAWETVRSRLTGFLAAVGARLGNTEAIPGIVEQVRREIDAVHALPVMLQRLDMPGGVAAALLPEGMGPDSPPPAGLGTPLVAALLRPLGWMAAPAGFIAETPCLKLLDPHKRAGARNAPPQPAAADNKDGFDIETTTAAWMREWFLTKQLAKMFQETRPDKDTRQAAMDALLVRIAIAHGNHLLSLATEIWTPLVYAIFEDPDVRAYLLVNRFGGRRWMNREQLMRLMPEILRCTAAGLLCNKHDPIDIGVRLAQAWDDATIIMDAAAATGYDLDWMLESLK